MRITVLPSSVSGTLQANPSKSHAQRAIALATLTHGTSTLTGVGSSGDVMRALSLAEALGARVLFEEEAVNITGGGQLQTSTWGCGESGLCLRMYSAIAGLFDAEITLTARGTLRSRPVDFMAHGFAQLGVTFSSNEGIPPVRIKGPYNKYSAVIDGSVSSQFLTGLLIALPQVRDNSILEVRDLRSRPYIDLTLRTIQEFGVHIYHESFETYHVDGGQKYRPVDLRIQGDWSGMAFMLVAAAVAGDVHITGLPPVETQADGKVVEVLKSCGAHVEVQNGQVSVRRQNLHAFDFDCTHCPDLFPPLVALAAHCSGTSRIKGAHRLRSKESDRDSVLINEFAKLGVEIILEDDTLIVKGGVVSGGTTNVHGDHRIAMALATAALRADSPVTISGAEFVAKSYPDFFKDLELLSAFILYKTEGDE